MSDIGHTAIRWTSRAILLLSIATVSLTLNHCTAPIIRANGQLDHELYIWQRSWSGAVRESIAQASPQSAGLVVLGAEVAFDEGELESIRVAIDYDSLRESEIPLGLAFRIGAWSGDFSEEGEPVTTLADIAEDLVYRARESQVDIKELQLDFDCPEACLDGYRVWVETIRRRIEPTRLTITVLPCWLRHPEFKKLAEVADGYVLQVHSLEAPGGIDDDFSLCDPSKAVEWIEQAARLGLPFRVALPTYGYILEFDDEGKFVRLYAEGPSMVRPEGVQLREARADPKEMADLVAALTEDRPANLEGLIWYRMPVRTDRLNWPWPTLTAVMEGREPRSSLHAEVRKSESGLLDIELCNDGETDESPMVAISVSWNDARLLASDALRGFELTARGESGAILRLPSNTSSPILERIPPGESWPVAWLLLDGDTEVEIDVSSIQD